MMSMQNIYYITMMKEDGGEQKLVMTKCICLKLMLARSSQYKSDLFRHIKLPSDIGITALV